MSHALARAVALLALAGAGSAQDDGRGWRWAELDLELWIEPDLGSAHLEGHGRLVLAGESSAGPVLELNGALLAFEHVDARGATSALGERKEEEQRVASARITLAKAATRGAELAVDFACQSTGTSDQFAVTPKGAVASWVEAWYPAPASGPDGSLSRAAAAPGTTRFHLPEGWHSVSNGERVEGAGDEPDSELWRVAEPVARSFACAPFTEIRRDVGGRTVAIHRLASTRDGAEVELAAVSGILRILEERYGPYPYPSYRVAELPLGVGDFLGSSEQGFIMVRPVAFDAPDGNLALFGHELAHGWWGNRVSSAGPGSILLDEGLSQYSAVVAIEALEGEAAAADFLRFSRPGYVDEQCARGYFRSWPSGQDQALSTLTGAGPSHFLADAKGHWVWHMLRQRMGDERFFGVLRGCVTDFAATSLTLAELRSRCERAAPEAGLATFFAQWLDRPGAPVLEAELRAEGAKTRVTVRQLQPGEPYRLELELALDSPEGRSVHAVELSEREASFLLEGRGAATAVELDPRHRLLLWTSDYGPAPVH